MKKFSSALLGDEYTYGFALTDHGHPSDEIQYSNAAQSSFAVGGIPAGTTFDGVTLESVLNDLFYGPVELTTALNADTSTGPIEFGSAPATIDFTAVPVTVGEPVVSFTFQVDGVDQVTQGSATWQMTSVPASDFTVKVIVATATETAEASLDFTYVYPIYHGIADQGRAALVRDDHTLSADAQATSYTKTFEIPSGATPVYYFAYPAGYGLLTSIQDWNGFDILGSFTQSVQNITGADGSVQSYNVYEFDNPVVDTVTRDLTFNF